MEVDYSVMLLPKQSWTKKGKTKLKKTPKHKRRKSIMQSDKDKRCFLCMLEGDYTEKETEEHHVIYGSGRRQISEEYGLRVRLCKEHHRTANAGVHNNEKTARILKEIAQRRFKEEYPDKDWMEVVGKNYLKEEDDGEVIV